MVCEHCGAAIPEQHLFCPNCGNTANPNTYVDEYVYLNIFYQGGKKDITFRARDPLFDIIGMVALKRTYAEAYANERNKKYELSGIFKRTRGYKEINPISSYSEAFLCDLMDVITRYHMVLFLKKTRNYSNSRGTDYIVDEFIFRHPNISLLL